MSSAVPYTLAVRVADADIDRQGHVNNIAWLKYVQDAAVAHWQAVAPAEVQAAVAWVVRRHEVDYLKPGFAGDELVIRTWVGEPAGATWERFTEVTRQADGQILVKARTVWVQLDAATGRPRRVDARLTGWFSADEPGSA
jgi:acyl-CoA thioester hydrolase